MNDRLILLALQEMEGIGWKTVHAIVSQVPDLAELTEYRASDFVRLGVRPDRAIALSERLGEKLEAGTKRYDEARVRVLTVLDPEYPDLLRRISQPPWVLYALGRTELLSGLSIAVVGTRTPTVYGRRAAEELAGGLSAAGFRVVSGLARGIDACAHRGALGGPGGTVAVMGGGLDTIYPPDHEALFRRIALEGLLLSEMPFGTTVHPGLFPLRNRIIAGLTQGTLVVEAAGRSGSLITAELALGESRDVFAVPGPIHAPKSRGTNKLIQDGGAKLVMSAEDVIGEYNHLSVVQYKGSLGSGGPEAALTGDESRVLSLLSGAPATIDLLLAESRMDFGHLHSVLLSLIIKRKIAQIPGSAYVIL